MGERGSYGEVGVGGFFLRKGRKGAKLGGLTYGILYIHTIRYTMFNSYQFIFASLSIYICTYHSILIILENSILYYIRM